MRVGSVTLGQIATFLIVLSLGHPIPSEAGVFWNENFENHLTPNWNTSACDGSPQDGCNPSISTDIAHTGTHSLKGNYTGPCAFSQTIACGNYIDHSHTPTANVWSRFYYYTVGFTYMNVGSGQTKNIFHRAQNANLDFVIDHEYGSLHFSMQTQPQLPEGPPCLPNDVACNYPPNVGSVPINDGRWYCIETHGVVNTPGQANGSFELWVDGTQTLGWYNRQFSGSPQPLFSEFKIYIQSGSGLMYYDDVAVGDTRIGCGVGQPLAPGVGAPDITPPSAPAGLRLQ